MQDCHSPLCKQASPKSVCGKFLCAVLTSIIEKSPRFWSSTADFTEPNQLSATTPMIRLGKADYSNSRCSALLDMIFVLHKIFALVKLHVKNNIWKTICHVFNLIANWSWLANDFDFNLQVVERLDHALVKSKERTRWNRLLEVIIHSSYKVQYLLVCIYCSRELKKGIDSLKPFVCYHLLKVHSQSSFQYSHHQLNPAENMLTWYKDYNVGSHLKLVFLASMFPVEVYQRQQWR